MPRIYKPLGPSSNKAAKGPAENKTAATVKPADDGKKKSSGDDK